MAIKRYHFPGGEVHVRPNKQMQCRICHKQMQEDTTAMVITWIGYGFHRSCLRRALEESYAMLGPRPDEVKADPSLASVADGNSKIQMDLWQRQQVKFLKHLEELGYEVEISD